MRIITRLASKAFCEKEEYKDSALAIKAWVHEAMYTEWKRPADIKKHYRNASFIAKNRVMFNIHGNKYRFIDSHKQYEKIDAESV
jgi:mRNA interferase HigB